MKCTVIRCAEASTEFQHSDKEKNKKIIIQELIKAKCLTSPDAGTHYINEK